MKYTRRTILAHRRKWLAALRSGELNQTSGWLHNPADPEHNGDDAYCCLGVACVLAKVPSIPKNIYGHPLSAIKYGAEGDNVLLPYEGRDWLGVTEANPDIDFPYWDKETGKGLVNQETGDPIHKGYLALAEMNDDGFTFEQIADMVEYFGFLPDHDQLQGAA